MPIITLVMRTNAAPTLGDEGWLKLVNEQVSRLRFGVVQIVVHDSRVVQVERTEKFRLPATGHAITDSAPPENWSQPHHHHRNPTGPTEESRP